MHQSAHPSAIDLCVCRHARPQARRASTAIAWCAIQSRACTEAGGPPSEMRLIPFCSSMGVVRTEAGSGSVPSGAGRFGQRRNSTLGSKCLAHSISQKAARTFGRAAIFIANAAGSSVSISGVILRSG